MVAVRVDLVPLPVKEKTGEVFSIGPEAGCDVSRFRTNKRIQDVHGLKCEHICEWLHVTV
jgi:hypothetical protein